MRSLINFWNISSVIIWIVLSCSFSFSQWMHMHSMRQCATSLANNWVSMHKPTHCGKVFTNVFAYDQHHNHATQAGTLWASIMMREELTAVCLEDRFSAVLSALPRWGNERDAHSKRYAQADELVALQSCLPETPSEIHTNSGHMEAIL